VNAFAGNMKHVYMFNLNLLVSINLSLWKVNLEILIIHASFSLVNTFSYTRQLIPSSEIDEALYRLMTSVSPDCAHGGGEGCIQHFGWEA
jgi:hypothetical protein